MAAQQSGVIAGFRQFIARGNAIEMAVGIVIGAAFTSVVNAIVEKVINPLIAGVVGKPNFDNVLEFHLGTATVQPGAVITALVNFLLVAAAIYFVVIVPMNKLNDMAAARKKTEAEAEASPVDPNIELLTQIRDLLAERTPRA
ncbi:MAG: large conductance mechanosensitive channel protein MscL [Actinomycetaceae bacterium]|nr:large conductance mechanosensitive channel protein MscL [Actinomycetaceae bacterium]